MMIENIFIIQRKPKTLKQARKVKSTFTVHGLISTHGVKLLKTKIVLVSFCNERVIQYINIASAICIYKFRIYNNYRIK